MTGSQSQSERPRVQLGTVSEQHTELETEAATATNIFEIKK